MAAAEHTSKLNNEDSYEIRSLSGGLSAVIFSAALLKAMPIEKLIENYLKNQDTLIEAFSIINEMNRQISCLIEKNNLNNVEMFGRSSNSSSALGINRQENTTVSDSNDNSKSNTSDNTPENESKNSSPSNPGNNQSDRKDKKPRKRPKRKKGCIDNLFEGQAVHKRDVTFTDEQLIELFGTCDSDKIAPGPLKTYRVCRYVPGFFYEEDIVIHTVIDPDSGKVLQPAVADDFKEMGKSYMTNSILIDVIVKRFQLAIAYARLERFYQQKGFSLNRQLMADAVIRIALNLFEAIISRMWTLLIASGYLQIDETPSIIREVRRINGTPNSLCYMWDFRTSEMYEAGPPIIIFHYDESRGEEVLKECLGDFQGTFISDCHKPYHSYTDKNSERIKCCGCLNHSRSRFADVMKAIPGLKELPLETLKEIPAYNVICCFKEIFKYDKSIRNLAPEERKKKREELVKPAFNRLAEYIESFGAKDFIKGGLMDKAITYFKNNRSYFEASLDDPFIPNNNSACERDNAGYAILRNNIKFIDTIDGAYATAIMYSIKATCAANKADFESYLAFVMEKVQPLIKNKELSKCKDMVILDEYMPWSDQFRKYEKERKEKRKAVITSGNLYLHEKNHVDVSWPVRKKATLENGRVCNM